MQRRACLAGQPAFITNDIEHTSVGERQAVHEVGAQGVTRVHPGSGNDTL